MSKSKNSIGFKALRDELRKGADIIDELLELEKREELGENVEKECEAIMGRFMVSMVNLEIIIDKL